MTPIERARLRCGCGQCKPWEINPDAPKVVREHCRVVDLYDVQIEAVAAESEACAKIAAAEKLSESARDDRYWSACDEIERQIRARTP